MSPALPPAASRHLLGANAPVGACGRQWAIRCTGNNCCSQFGYCGSGSSSFCNSKSQSPWNAPGKGGGRPPPSGGRDCAAFRSDLHCNAQWLCSRYGLPGRGTFEGVSDCVSEDLCNDINKGRFGPVPGPYRDTYCRINPTSAVYRDISINGIGTVFCDPKRKGKPGRRIFQAPASAALPAANA